MFFKIIILIIIFIGLEIVSNELHTQKTTNIGGVHFHKISKTNQHHINNLAQDSREFINSAKETTESLTGMFDLISDILKENRENIYISTNSLKNSMKNIEDLTSKINNEITKQTIRNNINNIELTTSNLANSSEKFVSVSENIHKTSTGLTDLNPRINKVVDTIQIILCNVNDIIVGFKNTLKQRFGGARIIFGKPIKD